jgi:orotate phosphoribosyltransferase
MRRNLLDMNYGETLYNRKELKKALPYYVRAINRLCKQDKKLKVLISTGSSGSILATAILLHARRNLVHLHVGKEAGHHGHISGNKWDLCGENHAIFVDDFIESGHSLDRCIEHVENICSNVKLNHCLVAFKIGVANGAELRENYPEIAITFANGTKYGRTWGEDVNHG